MQSPFDDEWEAREDRILAAAGCKSSFSGTNFAIRDLGFVVDTFGEAEELKKRIDDSSEQASVTIRES